GSGRGPGARACYAPRGSPALPARALRTLLRSVATLFLLDIPSPFPHHGAERPPPDALPFPATSAAMFLSCLALLAASLLTSLVVPPAAIDLAGPRAEQHLGVLGSDAQGKQSDLSWQAVCTIAP